MDAFARLLTEYDVLGALWMTIKLTLASAVGALVIGTVVAVCRVSPVAVLRGFGTAYVTLIRNTPLTLIVFFCLFGVSNTLQVQLADPSSPTSIAAPGARVRGCRREANKHDDQKKKKEIEKKTLW